MQVVKILLLNLRSGRDHRIDTFGTTVSRFGPKLIPYEAALNKNQKNLLRRITDANAVLSQ